MGLSDERAIVIVTRQGFGKPADYGPNAPTTIKSLIKTLEDDRKRGFSLINEMYAPGMTAMAAPVQRPGEPAIGVITIAGPLSRLTEQRMLELGPDLLTTAKELAAASSASPMFTRRALADQTE
jgi:DNA-binding IclR family transcriptional regulator